MSWFDDIAAIKTLERELDPHFVKAIRRKYHSEGLSRDGTQQRVAGGTKDHAPRSDYYDGKIDNAEKRYTTHLAAARKQLEEAVRAQQGLVTLGEDESDDAADTDEWCVSCLRVQVGKGQSRHRVCNPRAVDREIDTRYCRWCRGFVKEHGEMPHPELIRAKEDGRRVTLTLIGQYHKVAS